MRTGEKPILISVIGPTAVGKTKLAVKLARKYNTVILSTDARQFYRELEVGTAKPSAEELTEARHYFIDNLSIQDTYNAGSYEKDAIDLLAQLFEDNQVVVTVGGSGLYSQALWYGIDDMPEIDKGIRKRLNQIFETKGLKALQDELKEVDPIYYEQVDLKNHTRLIRALEVVRSTGQTYSSFRVREQNSTHRSFDCLKIGLEMERSTLYQRIDMRMDQMIDSGLFEEAEKLLPYKELQALQTVGYQEIFEFLEGAYLRDEAIRLLKRNSRRYAKRQMTWFKKDKTINWFQVDNQDDGFAKILDYLKTAMA